ncbi:hypothetical protein [Brevibacillus laterosporus]|uniref:hypothetical protein n=1 Tax=Brevibacillus laterosporus TaxID=1465 RepID=UPI00264CF58F|nr:hypothetical protein [Brevibacillus laterosporus]MDN9010038.1 hypothetical protein [Brevibacillus laterosporus]MDO0940580.1 hypothetical protein [Brevibacillus laterosporus]
MKTTEEQRLAIFFDDECGFDYEKVETTPWEDQGKYSVCNCIFKTFDERHFMFDVERAGSYFGHYEYGCWGDVVEVEEVTRTVEITQWEEVTKGDDALSHN